MWMCKITPRNADDCRYPAEIVVIPDDFNRIKHFHHISWPSIVSKEEDEKRNAKYTKLVGAQIAKTFNGRVWKREGVKS